MLRKLSLVAVAAASLGAAALAPTSASAWHGGWHTLVGWGGPRVVVGGPASAVGTAAATCGDWSRPPGVRAGG